MKKNDQDLENKSDEQLMEVYQMGSDAAFNILFLRHSSRVYSYLLKRLSQKKEAEDLLQTVFLKLHRSKHLYKSTLPFSPWLFSIARSVLLDFLKKKNLEVLVEADEFDKLPSETPMTPEADLREFVIALPKAQSQAVTLRIYDDQTFEEIAQRLSTTPENARQLFSRGLKKLKQALVGKEK